MVDLCRSSTRLHWLADVIVALAATGMRIGELAALRWSDVDLYRGEGRRRADYEGPAVAAGPRSS